jgi:hypothetical protein
VEVVEILLKAGAKVDAVIPPCYSSPQHAQYPLAHACRQGHEKVVKLLLSNPTISEQKDQQNDFGWTALHECAFYNRPECVKLMLVYGCDGSLRTKRGLRAIDMTLSPEVQTLLLELVPEDERASFLEKSKQARAKENQQKELEKESIRTRHRDAAERRKQMKEGKEAVLGEKDVATKESDEDESDDSDDSDDSSAGASDKHDQTKISEGKQSESYRLLGDLPDLGGGDKQRKSKNNKRRKNRRGSKSKSGQSGRVATPESGVPHEFCCSLTGKQMSDPVRTPFGDHRYQRNAVERWLKEQGNLDPVTGMPLATCELIPDHPLRIEINDWQLQESLKGSSGEPDLGATEPQARSGKQSILSKAKLAGSQRSELDIANDKAIPTGGGDDDLYDF